MSELWITVNTAADLLQVSERTIRRQCALNKYTVQTVSSNVGRGGVSYQIDLASLPERAQIKYWETRNDVTGKPDPSAASGSSPATGEPRKATSPQTPLQCGEGLTDSRIQSGTTNEAQRLTRNEQSSEEAAHDMQRQQTMQEVVSLNAKNREILERNLEMVEFFKGLKGAEIDSALIQWNSEHGDSLNKRTVYRILQKFRDGGAAAVAGKYGKSAGTSTIPDEWWRKFMQVYAALGNKTSLSACREIVRGYAIKTGEIEPDGDFPSRDAFRRRLNREPQAVVEYMREGKDHHKRYHSLYIDVNRDSIQCGQIFVADHAKFDFFVQTKDGRLVRPWISAMCDYKSRMIVGYDLFLDEPNGDHIIIVLKRSFENYGIPQKLLFDNGKDYRRKDIGGGRPTRTSDLIENYTPTIVNILGIEVKYAIPYNSQTKPIERVFGIFRQYFDKFMPGYVGSDGKQRPDKTKELELKAAKLMRQKNTADSITKAKDANAEYYSAQQTKNEVAQSTKNKVELPVLQFDEWENTVREFIDIYNHRVFESGKQAGLSPVGIWQKDSPVMRAPETRDLAILCASSGNPVRVSRNALRDTRSGERYWAPWTAKWEGGKQYFFLRIDPEKPETAYCFYADYDTKENCYKLGSFAGTADRIPSVSLYDDSEENRAELARQMEIKNGLVRYAKNELKKAVGDPLSPDETLELMKISVMADHKAACAAAGISAEDPGAPAGKQITRFSSVAHDIEEAENAGVMSLAVAQHILEKKKDEEPKIVRFRKYVITKEDEDD